MESASSRANRFTTSSIGRLPPVGQTSRFTRSSPIGWDRRHLPMRDPPGGGRTSVKEEAAAKRERISRWAKEAEDKFKAKPKEWNA